MVNWTKGIQPDSGKYLVETHPQDRENEAVETLLSNPWIAEQFFGSLGLDSFFSWSLLRVKEKRLGGSSESDIDILAGRRLAWNDPNAFTSRVSEEARVHPEYPSATLYELAARILAASGGIQWPPPTDYLVAIEAKCAYKFRDELKSTKGGKGKVQGIRGKVKSLLEIGFDRVILLDIIANPPPSGLNGQAWMAAIRTADDSAAHIESLDILQKRLPSESPAGHWACSIGSVIGGNERIRGAPAWTRLREASPNPLHGDKPDIQMNRCKLDERLRTVLATLPAPKAFPVVFVDCGDNEHPQWMQIP